MSRRSGIKCEKIKTKGKGRIENKAEVRIALDELYGTENLAGYNNKPQSKQPGVSQRNGHGLL